MGSESGGLDFDGLKFGCLECVGLESRAADFGSGFTHSERLMFGNPEFKDLESGV